MAISHYPFEIPESWEWTTIGDIGEIITGNTPAKERKEFYGKDFPFFKPSDLEQGLNVKLAQDNLSIHGYNVSRKLPSHSILVTCIGATIGKVGLITKEGTCNQQINAILANSNFVSLYIYYYCISSFFQSQIKNNTSATTLLIINKGKFEQLFIPLPPLLEQKRIVRKIEEVFASLNEITNLVIA